MERLTGMDARTLSVRSRRSERAFADLRELLRDLPKPADEALVADILAECATPGETLVVGVTGSVAAGKTTFCTATASHLRSTLQVEIASTDGFLLPNTVLAERGLLKRKGYPETYDADLLSGALQRARWGLVCIPGYSHTTYDRAADFDRTIDRPDILIVEGLGLSPSGGPRDPAALLDMLIYLDASESDIETWFTSRFMKFWREAEGNPSSFYARFRNLSEEEAEAFAHQVWTSINLPNLREHIAPARNHADLLVSKSADHRMVLSAPSFQ
jgi:type I pantothenate kinase